MKLKHLMGAALCATLISPLLAPEAQAGPIQLSAFGQSSSNNTLTGTANGTNTATALDVVDAQINISQLFGQAAPLSANFTLHATSFDAVQNVSGFLVQHFNGTFCLTLGSNCGGTNLLSGVFTDAALGRNGGVGLVVNVANPPDLLTLTSDVIAASNLGSPNTFNLSFSNVTPALSQCGTTLCSFTASLSGTISSFAQETQVPEPASIAFMAFGLGVLGFGFQPRRRKPAQLASA